MKIELVDHMGTDSSVSNSARVSFHKYKEKFDDGDVKLINYLAKHKHFSPFTHTSISLRCKAPIFLARQLGKHQVGLSWNEVSRRYVDEEPEFYIPDAWRAKPDGSIKQGSGNKLIEDMYVTMDKYRTSPEAMYRAALDESIFVYDEMIANGVAPEMARMVLPQSMMTEWIWTGSLLAFHRVYSLRIDPHAQKEANDFAKILAEVIEPLFPNSWRALINA